MKPSQTLIEALQSGLKMPITLERLYPIDIWHEAETLGWTEERNFLPSLPEDLNTKILKTDETINDYVKDEWAAFLLKNIQGSKKMHLAKRAIKKGDEFFDVFMPNMAKTMDDVLNYLKS